MIIPSKEDMKALVAKYLPLSGGAMSGVIYADNSKAAYVGDDGKNGIQLRFVSGVTDTFAKVSGGDLNLQAKVTPGKVTYQSYVNLSVNDGVSIGAPNTVNSRGVTINNVVTPTTDDMATNKKYVDDAIQAAIQDTWEASY